MKFCNYNYFKSLEEKFKRKHAFYYYYKYHEK